MAIGKNESIGKDWLELICNDVSAGQPLRGQPRKASQREFVMPKAGGENVDVLQTVTPITFDDREAVIESFVDITELKKSVEKIAFIQTELIEELLAKGTIKAADFTPPVRQIYQTIKTIVDRAKPGT